MGELLIGSLLSERMWSSQPFLSRQEFPMATMSPLRQRMIEDMTVRNLSRSTQQSYIYAVAKFSRHFDCPPDRLGTEDVRAYQLHLIEQKFSWSHINQVACALRFFYGITLGQKEAFERIVSGKEPEKLPPVLNREEIARFLNAVVGMRNRVALTTAYAAGLRIGEGPGVRAGGRVGGGPVRAGGGSGRASERGAGGALGPDPHS